MKKEELYSRAEYERLTKKNRIWKIVVISLYAAILVAELVIALMLTTENKSRLIYWMMGVSIAVGWIAIYFRVFRYSRGRAEAEHQRNMLEGEREKLTGTLKLTDEVLRIKRSITLRKAELYNADGRHRLNVHVDRAAKLPEGLLTVWTVSNYVVAFEAPESAEPSGKGPRKKRFKFLRNVFSQLHAFAFWAILSLILWGWIFSNVTDVARDKKVEIFVNAYDMQYKELRLELERDMPEGIRMVKVHLFTDALFGDKTFLGADIYIVKASEVEELRESFWGEGVKVYDAATGEGAADEWIVYAIEEEPAEDYYMFYGINSKHTGRGDGDDAALKVGERLLELGKEPTK